jgi:hypothetical protein
MESMTRITTGEMIYVDFPRAGRVSAQVAWAEGNLAGCRFLQPISSGALSAALLRAVPQATPLAAVGSAVQFDPKTGEELSRRQKLLVLLGLSMLTWVALLAVGYAGLRLLNA